MGSAASLLNRIRKEDGAVWILAAGCSFLLGLLCYFIRFEGVFALLPFLLAGNLLVAWSLHRRRLAKVTVELRKKIEESLEKQEVFESLIDNTPVFIFIKDPEGRFLFFNRHFVASAELTQEDVLGKTDYDFFDKTTADLFRENDLLAVRSLKVMEFEETAVINGKSKTCITYKLPIFRQDGSLLGVGGISTDISDRKRLESELKVAKDTLELRVQERTKDLERSRQRLRALTAHLQTVREEERTSISREVHDRLGQNLMAIKFELRKIQAQADPKSQLPTEKKSASEILADIDGLVDLAVVTTQRIAADLRPKVLDDFGLLTALEWETQEFSRRTGIRHSLSLDAGDLDFASEASTTIFRIFQEIITNVARHAGASRIRVAAWIDGGLFNLEVSDNGAGIQPDEISNMKSLGLLGMSERASLLNGDLEFRGEPGIGTTVTLRVPIRQIIDQPIHLVKS